ncbi:hypothetical protein GCM10007276_04550 [Agaricicola taiwanensis]|uniref:DUF481 domain-containing protein n=1 Tax=Agaricicola taiwanensis TaxID=591372 RepID=A0A8J2YAU3_9RHOB|nr:hypothetical protein [Agaricicola taiwanensis]GGE30429.1 hypothetical protein GCM10007276_04550 [Agaricicola taiwanensis]
MSSISFQILAVASALIATSVRAQSVEDVIVSDAVEMSCFDQDLPADVRLLCDGLGETVALTLDKPVAFPVAQTPRAARPSLAKRQVTPELTAWGLTSAQQSWPSLPRPPQDRGVGVRLRSASTPVTLSTEMVQPGDASTPAHFYWRMETARGAPAQQTGLFWGGAAAGAYRELGQSESLNGYAGVRRVVHPSDNWRIGAEITPRIAVEDLATLSSSVAIEPKLTSHAALDLASKSYQASVDVDLGYRMPLDQNEEPSGYGRLRLTIKAR